jgi:hypothetical protein
MLIPALSDEALELLSHIAEHEALRHQVEAAYHDAD